MKALPLIVGMGGINAAGRTSFNQAFRRIVIDKLTDTARQETFVGLACLMNLVSFDGEQYVDAEGKAYQADEIEAAFKQDILEGTLIRRIEKTHFDVDATHWQRSMALSPKDGAITFNVKAKELPQPTPSSWVVNDIGDGMVSVEITESLLIKHDSYMDNPIKAAGQLPSGLDISTMYNSRYQPRGLQATIFAATDAIRSTGIDWDVIVDQVSPDHIGVYSSSVAGQMQSEGFGGLIKNRMKGDRVTTKNLALGLNTMPTDFINAYVTGNVGTTFTSSGACATFLYNLKAAVQDIQAGRVRVAIAGSSECAITQEVIEGFCNMSALANEENLKKLDGATEANWRKTSRPFGKNCGFTIGEGAQYVVLMDDALAVELGAHIHGAIPDVFVNADGVKKSITAPGPGNYITMAKSVALSKAMLGEESIQQRSFVMAHGSSTPANRVTESHIFHLVAESFGIENWPVVAPKAFVGHTIGPASGDQVALAAGVFEENIMPGVTTIDEVASDVYDQHLNIALDHWQCPDMDVAFINSKGFGGNNATAPMLSGKVVSQMLAKRYSEQALSDYAVKLEKTQAQRMAYKSAADNAQFDLIYRFGKGMIDEAGIQLDQKQLTIPEFKHAIELPQDNPYGDMM
ncbi:beta-ketoacyl synthase [Thalassotalea agarivorans]|uniref:Ketosynthase family 3 (KS3) domain-containing protein n=1 Tax=Thalassotalea agarivorans TaxID=349064 RepID=A0A1I0AWH8_THASX|nr:beta-ketoacyl synthase [Thalassotalea agarivorans]SES98134.1 hypothetical protein SAMN05660429_00825 [Thalassotalea agarivorans]